MRLSEIKVTKTLAKKRTTPMKDMATKAKMKKKKKGKDGKIKKDAQKPMNRNVHDLANITLKGEYRS
jgi:ribosome recycling factor